jgi:hypothetical protein
MTEDRQAFDRRMRRAFLLGQLHALLGVEQPALDIHEETQYRLGCDQAANALDKRSVDYGQLTRDLCSLVG